MDKDDITCDLFGSIDELSATLGLVRAEGPSVPFAGIILRIQQELIAFCADIASGSATISSEHVRQIESDTERFEAELPTISQFIISGDNRLSAMLHLARTVCRRAERTLTTYCRTRKNCPDHADYLNRLSDLLFAMARKAAECRLP
ncbi:MAG: cob(I)yrinic acid a,c-diamide adenosyltransferase [Planctomycetaceae bacterium]|nr:cob(I)yrinic acid a,c-diamide adenosyltransferase [Planctomycetaceae bacterium]